MNLTSTINDSIEEAYISRNDYWNGSIFEKLAALQNDERGKWGEKFLHSLLTCACIPSQWDGDSNTNQSDGTYDLKLLNQHQTRIEVKTSASEANWQHEPIISEPDWDLLILIDLNYDHLFLSIFTHDELKPILIPGISKHVHLGVGAHLRKSKNAGYKFDLSPASMQRSLTHGYTFSYDMNAPDDTGLLEFLRSKCI